MNKRKNKESNHGWSRQGRTAESLDKCCNNIGGDHLGVRKAGNKQAKETHSMSCVEYGRSDETVQGIIKLRVVKIVLRDENEKSVQGEDGNEWGHIIGGGKITRESKRGMHGGYDFWQLKQSFLVKLGGEIWEAERGYPCIAEDLFVF